MLLSDEAHGSSRGPHSLAPLKSSANWAYSHIWGERSWFLGFCLWEEARNRAGRSRTRLPCLSLGERGFWGWRVNRGTVPVSAAVLAWQQEGAGCIGPADTVPTPHCSWEHHFIVPSRHWGTKPREPAQLEMAGSIHAECLACSGTFLPCVSQETTSYFPSCLWQETGRPFYSILSRLSPFLRGGETAGGGLVISDN